jgi:hypothetical protein
LSSAFSLTGLNRTPKEEAELKGLEVRLAQLEELIMATARGAIRCCQPMRSARRKSPYGGSGWASSLRSLLFQTKSAASTPPAAYLCPIRKELMADPVCTADGHTFEREAIATWLATHSTSPLTGLRLAHTGLTDNHSLRGLILEWRGL